MRKEMIDYKNLRFVGDLQNFGTSYASLYVDSSNRQLYLLVRVSPPTDSALSFGVVKVNPTDIQRYMSEDFPISDFFLSQPYTFVEIKNKTIRQIPFVKELPDNKMDNIGLFDPEFCENEIWIELFLKRLQNNQPLAVV